MPGRGRPTCSSPSSDSSPSPAHPALDAGCAQAGKARKVSEIALEARFVPRVRPWTPGAARRFTSWERVQRGRCFHSSASGMCCPGVHCPWLRAPFPPSPPHLRMRRCSATSLVLWARSRTTQGRDGTRHHAPRCVPLRLSLHLTVGLTGCSGFILCREFLRPCARGDH
jgi:hypothetical protein